METRISRRSVIRSLSAGAATFTLVPAMVRGAQQATPEASIGSTTFPLEITTAAGTATVPAVAERIIALSYPDVDTTIALGVIPIAMQTDGYTESGISAWFADTVTPEDVQLLTFDPNSSDLPLEEFVALTPDLILDTLGFRSANAYDQLSEIAPTISGMPPITTDALVDRTRLIGQLLGKEAEAETALAATDAAIDGAATQFPGLQGLTFSYAYVRSPENIGAIADPDYFTAQLFRRWGMTIAPALTADGLTADPAPGGVTLSWEQIDLLDADAILLGFTSPDLQAQFEASPLFTQLPAVQNGRYLPLTQELTVAVQVPSIANLPWVVEQLTPFFETLTD